MSGKNAKHSQPKAPAESQRAEWTVRTPSGEVHVPVSVLHLSLDGARQFRDEAGIVADFPAGIVMGVLRKPPREPVQVTLPARFVTQPAAVREFQAALSAAFGVQVILLPPSSKAADAVSEPQ